MTDARFRFAPEILRRLGEELNPSADQGIIELVKNAYDANAGVCRVAIENSDRVGGEILVADNGDGMSLNEIVDGWLVLGRSQKIRVGRGPNVRLPAGSKGLGRLAALRLGNTVEVTSRPRDEPGREFKLRIDWRDFDRADVVESVPLSIESLDSGGREPGTEIKVTGLHKAIERTQVRRLARSLVLLADPFSDDSGGFDTKLDAPEFTDLERLVRGRYFGEAEFHLRATVDGNGIGSARLLDFKGAELAAADHDELRVAPDDPKYSCPPVTFDLWAFLLSADRFRLRSVSMEEVRTWLGTFGGVHLYVNGLRVAPYGEPGHDWLEMNLARARSPEERPSTNNAIGRVVVEDVNDVLVQKTDRSGFIESDEFTDLRTFATDALEWMARRRLSLAETRRRRGKRKVASQATVAREELKAQIAASPPKARKKLESAFTDLDRAVQTETSALRREVDLYRTLSTAGITAATLAHESSGTPLKVLEQAIRAIDRRARPALGEQYESVLGAPVAQIRRGLKSLGVLSTATLRLLDHQKRRIGKVDAHRVLEDVADMFGPFLEDRGVRLEIGLCPGTPSLRGSEAALESIVTNLITNSVVAFEIRGQGPREIEIDTKCTDSELTIEFVDSGPGIVGIALDDIWLPGQTTRPNGTGLGLTIVRDAASDFGGAVDAVPHGRLGGAEMIIRLPTVDPR